MSTILKALRRLEDDRNAHTSLPLREAVTSGGQETSKRRGGSRLWLGGLALVVAVSAAGVAYWLASRPLEPAVAAPVAKRPRPTSAPAVALAPERPRRNPVAERAVLPAAVPVVAEFGEETRELPPEALASLVERVERPAAPPRIADPDEEAKAIMEETGSSRSVVSTPVAPSKLPGRHRLGSSTQVAAVPVGTTRRVRSEPAPPPESVRNTVVSEPKPPAPTPQTDPAESDPWEVARAATPEPPAPAPPPEAKPEAQAPPPPKPWRSDDGPVQIITIPDESASLESKRITRVTPKPQAEPTPKPAPRAEPEPTPKRTVVRAEVPSVRVEKTYWHPRPERRTALIEIDGDLEEIQEGDAVGPLVVSTIEPSGVVFDHEGIEIRRRIGE